MHCGGNEDYYFMMGMKKDFRVSGMLTRSHTEEHGPGMDISFFFIFFYLV